MALMSRLARTPLSSDFAAHHSLLRDCFSIAIRAVSPDLVLPSYLPALDPDRQHHLIGVGKAAASMAAACIAHYQRAFPGIVLTRYGHVCEGLAAHGPLRLIEAGHPVPDEAGRAAAEEIHALARALGENDHLIVLVSGGGSSLLARPVEGVSLSDKQKVTRDLLACGASISEINCVRKHLSSVKGGRLAVAAAPAKVTTLVISDVPGDDPALVASGPTLPDETTLRNARRILELYNIDPGPAVAAALRNPANETPKPGDAAFEGHTVRVVAKARGALDAACQFLHASGYTPVDLGDDIEGDATEMGTVHAALALHYLEKRRRVAIISGGELTVKIRNPDGGGGPNAEYLMSLALALNGAGNVSAMACDTDGIDGSQDNAGAIIDPTTLKRARSAGIDFAAALARNESYRSFQALGDLVITGPTLTNVNDLRVILVDP